MIVWVEVDEIWIGDGDIIEDVMKLVVFFEYEFWKRYKVIIIVIFF